MLNVKNVSKKHWFDTLGWGIMTIMHIVLLELPKRHSLLPLLLPLVHMKLQKLTALNGSPSIYMGFKNGRGFPSSFALRQLEDLPHVTIFFFFNGEIFCRTLVG
jgi:hypothetical protein